MVFFTIVPTQEKPREKTKEKFPDTWQISAQLQLDWITFQLRLLLQLFINYCKQNQKNFQYCIAINKQIYIYMYIQIKPSSQFGEKMKNQIEERMKFLTSGGATTKNIDAMEQVMQELKQENLYFETEEYVEKKKKKDKKKQKKLQEQTQQQIEEENIAEEPVQQDEQKKKKKKKKDDIQDEQQEDIKQQIDEVSQDKKTKKMKKSKIEQE
eukprot:TRINITY_DN786_c0_g1_i2.p4 TRINITY_DN786_c0_g1~~TRINITY_DN786_c0_g1_i2.p4  ORF type:complete len:211 (+),score=69.70 TRINITY_DN786_c0_g1_i2:1099-1731(+)